MPRNHAADKAAASAWARELLADPNWVLFDTETTALFDAEIVQIGLLRPDGTAAMDTLVKPCWEGTGLTSIPANVTDIHGITDAMVVDAPTLDHLLPQMAEVMHGRRVIVYNAPFDFEVLQGCLRRRWDHDRASTWLNSAASWECAMRQYAKWYGDWNSYRNDYKWQRLQGGDHSAIGDCRAALALLQKMAAE
jgi:DNA polymerase-3 subunit epsilon